MERCCCLGRHCSTNRATISYSTCSLSFGIRYLLHLFACLDALLNLLDLLYIVALRLLYIVVCYFIFFCLGSFAFALFFVSSVVLHHWLPLIVCPPLSISRSHFLPRLLVHSVTYQSPIPLYLFPSSSDRGDTCLFHAGRIKTPPPAISSSFLIPRRWALMTR